MAAADVADALAREDADRSGSRMVSVFCLEIVRDAYGDGVPDC